MRKDQHLPVPASSSATPPGISARTPVRGPPAPHVQDREFLPAALEILETPPSVIAVSFLWLICIGFAAIIGWAYFGKLDIYAVAAGKVQPAGLSKVVQPLESGKILSVLVENGGRVKEGDVLIELDPTETFADQEKLTQDLESVDAESARRRIAIEAARLEPSSPLLVTFKTGTTESVRLREQRALQADLAQFAASRETLIAQLAQQTATQRRLDASVAEREKLIALSKERVDTRAGLEGKGSGSRALVLEALAQYQTELISQATEQGQLQETAATIRTGQRKITETAAQFVAEQTEKLVTAERRRDQLQQELIKARSKNERLRLKASISGTVQQLSVTTVGQVVAGGQTLMTIVPTDTPIEIETMISNKDIGFVRAGQPAVVKVEAFPFTRYGTIDGTITKVSSDAVDIRSAPNLSDASVAVKAQGAATNSATSRPELAFPATVALAQSAINVDGRMVSLSPGMAVTVEIKTGTRRVIDYVLSPLREVVSEAARER